MNLRDKALLDLQQLVHVGVKSVLRHITVNVNILIAVFLANHTTVPLFQIGGAIRTVQVVAGDKQVLDIGAGAQLAGRA